MKQGFYIYFLFILLLSVQKNNAQHVPVEFNLIKGTSGKSLGKINDITQDKFGYMWFANPGNDCLIRFDGYNMKTYKYDPADSNSMGNGGGAECIAADSSGCIWTGTAAGVDKFDPATNKFIHYQYKATVNGGAIASILIDHLGIVWLGTNLGLGQLDPKTGKFTFYKHNDNDPSSISYNQVRSLYEDHEGVLWVGTGWEFDSNVKGGGLNKFNRETGTFTRYMHDPNDLHSLIGDKVRAIFEDSRGVFWVGTDGDGLHIMDRKKGTIERLTYDSSDPKKLSRPPVKNGPWLDHITFINEDGAGCIWIGTWNAGIVRYDPKTKEITHYDSTDKYRPKGFTTTNGWCSFTSRDGVLWISTESYDNEKGLGAELFRIDPLQTSFSTVRVRGDLWSFHEDADGTKWLCTRDEGLIKIDPKTHDTIYFKHNSVDPYSISNNGIFSIQPDTNGFYWVGTWNGLNHFDSKTNRFRKYLYNETSKGDQVDTMASTLLKGDNGELYIKTNYGFYIMNPQTKSRKIYQNNTSDTASLSVNTIVSSFKEKSGNIWLGTWNNGGLNLFDSKTKKFKHYLIGLIIWDIYRDTRGILWVATSNGLYYRNDNADTFIPVDEFGKEFRTANTRFVGLEDKEGNLWGSSSLGIFRFNPLKHELCIYGKKFFPNNDDWGKGEKTTDGKFLFTKHESYYTFFPKDVINAVAPRLILTDLKVNGHLVNPGANAPFTGTLEEAKEIKLNYDQNYFAISFAAIHYSSPEDNIDSIMLEGYDDKWIKSDSSKVAEYQNLSRGKYLFKIKACSSYGVWAEKEVKIIIEKPWWLTWWAIVLYIIGFLLILWPIIRWRTGALEKEKRILEQKVQQRTKELREEKELVESTLAELKSTQTQLIQSEKMASLGEMTAGIAHEIQNPLNFVNNFSEVSNELLDEMNTELEKGNPVDAKEIADNVKQNLEKIIYHGKRADAIVKSMLLHSRTSTGKKEPTDINALADEYLRLSYHGLRAKDKSFNARFETDLDNSIGKINIIPQDIGRVILNLINNAFYAVTEKKMQMGENFEPTVIVTTKIVRDKIEVRVKDNGNGIPQKVLDKIFQPFFTTKPTGQGTGLGLSLSYDIITKGHGGELRVETKEGQGTEFIVLLPK